MHLNVMLSKTALFDFLWIKFCNYHKKFIKYSFSNEHLRHEFNFFGFPTKKHKWKLVVPMRWKGSLDALTVQYQRWVLCAVATCFIAKVLHSFMVLAKILHRLVPKVDIKHLRPRRMLRNECFFYFFVYIIMSLI